MPRFVNNGDGTVTDRLTGLLWLQMANCFSSTTWVQALGDAATLASGACGLTDGSVAGDWRLPSVNELQSLVDYEYSYPALSNALGTGQYSPDDPFQWVHYSYARLYWSSTSDAHYPSSAWAVGFFDGALHSNAKPYTCFVWPVRGGR